MDSTYEEVLNLINILENDNCQQSISAYFDLQQKNSGIILPVIRRWPSISSSSLHFSFHCWLRLNHAVDTHPYKERRQLYSLYSDSIGLESFISNSSIYILVGDRREVVYIEIGECDDILDGCWHSLTIVHTAQRPSLFVAAFHSTSTCQLSVYIDGLLKKQVKDFKYVPIANEPIALASVGASSQRPRSSSLSSSGKSESARLTSTLAKTIQPFKDLFSSNNLTHHQHHPQEKQGRNPQNLMAIAPNSQDTFFGASTSLHGQLACVWMLAETLTEAQVKQLHSMGADFCQQLSGSSATDEGSLSSSIYDLLSSRSVLAYHPLACNGVTCVDISACSSQMHGRLSNGVCFRLRPFAQSLLVLGGCPVLYPLIELFKEPEHQQPDQSRFDSFSTLFSNPNSPADWIIVRQHFQKYLPDIDNRLSSNPIASVLNLLCYVLSSSSKLMVNTLAEEMTRHYNVELLAQHLNRIPSVFVDQSLLIAVQQLIESVRLDKSPHLLVNQLVQYVLLDFGLWNRAKFHVRIAHLQYVSSVIKDERKYYRTKFGVQFFLDVIKQYFNASDKDADEELQLRSAIFGILKYYVQRHIRLDELNALLSAISTLSSSSDAITHELLDFLLSLIDSSSSSSTDNTIGLLCEPNMAESLYALLTVNNLSRGTKEITMKIIKCLIGSQRVPQQVQARFKLETNNVGFGGIISALTPNELSVSIVRDILNLIITSESPIAVDHLNVVLTLCSAASLDVRYVAIRKLMTCFIAHPPVCRSYAKCHGWQETLAHFFAQTRRSIPLQSVRHSSASILSIETFFARAKDESIDSGRESATGMVNDTSSNNVQAQPHPPPPRLFEIASSPDDPMQTRLVRPLDLSPVVDSNNEQSLTRTFSTPRASLSTNSFLSLNGFLTDGNVSFDLNSTPEFLRRRSESINTPSQSSSNSREDLLSILKTENSIDDITSMSSNDALSFITPIVPTSVTSTEDTSLIVPSYGRNDDRGLLEELCETLILAIVMILWKGIAGSDDHAWTLRGQIFSALRHLHREYKFHLPLVYIERRILELSMETCLNDLKMNGGKVTPAYESNCRELIKLVDDFISHSPEVNERITENLVNGIISLLDTMLIFEENGTSDQSATTLISHDEHWTETSLTGLNILLNLLAHPNVSFCGQASVRIHSLLHSRPLNGREEAAYLLSSVYNILSNTSKTDDSEHYAHLLPIMKTIVDKSYTVLQMNVQIPNVPLHKATSSASDDFRVYCSSSESQEWQMFIQQQIEPLAEHYRSMSIRPFRMNMEVWWNNCHEMMMIGIHKRNRQVGEEKLKFQSQIVDQWRHRRRADHQRTLQLAKQRRVHQVHIEHEWQDRRKYLLGERGPWWNSANEAKRRWMLSDRENEHRMRCKLIENDNFNVHLEASRLRDNLGMDSVDESHRRFLEESLKNSALLIQKETTHGNSIDEQELLAAANETQMLLLEEREKMIIGTQCSLITSTSVNEGKLEITNKYIYFFDSTPQKTCQHDFKYPLSWLQDVQLRRYNLRPSALEFFLLNQTNFLINFDKKLRRQIYQKLMSLKLPSMKSSFSSLSTRITPQGILRESRITERWVAREISNFDYLMMLNTIAGRTYNDLNQYPIFPWVLKDYTSETLDLTDPNVFRDFSKPIGIQNPKHIAEVQLKYESFDDPTGLMKKFHYGTHYSNAAGVIHYLIRMEPFTTLHIQLHSGKFDIADRQFHSFQSSWTNIMDSPNDVRELIPEFFYLPEFLSNSNDFDLGILQISNFRLSDVQLPPWAKSPEEFIRLHRLALESDYVSAHLHEWIDLIFGYKQTGQAAVDALNVFMYCSYEKAVDVDAIDDPVTREAIEGMIQNFGQIPSQLLVEPHPQRRTREQAAFETESQGRALNIFQNLTHIRAFFVEITPANDKLCDPITFISIPKNQVRSLMQQGIPDTLVTVSVNGVVGNNGWQPYDKSLTNFFTFERDPTLQIERNRHIIAAPFSPSLEITSRLFAVSHDAKFLFSGGHWDWSLRVYSLLKSEVIESFIRHTDIITCLTLDSTGYILVTGSRDTTCIVWHVSIGDSRNTGANANDQEPGSLLLPGITLYGHSAEVSCVCVSTELDVVISGSFDGTCNIHTVEHGVYVRTLRPTGDLGDPVLNLKLSDERHLLVQTFKEQTQLFLYSINGALIHSEALAFQVVDVLLCDQHIVLAVNLSPSQQQTKSPNKGSSTTNSVASRIVIKDMFQMKTIQTIRLRTQINCLYLTKDFSHLLVGEKDGRLVVLIAIIN